ncbi:uncharacterized protein SAPINGB_P002330 [Magnusiomyces paraingens]|uniref:Uncharacterized protein n=1 Tax=Magnusiomyces paraingens TaxID=2606893 RepID=A0A5E8BFF8_9ASCO|nr:uncharacterized protein SAPINGB_P002330 [Saprochaete ingens]VVT49561.1 unnamed protein product [Saprochaete ingens]
MTIVRFEKIVLSGNTEHKKLVEVEPAEINLDTYQVPPNKILIKSEAFALNPADWKSAVFKHGPKGATVGCDVSGTVIKVSPEAADRFKVGDSVSGILRGSYYPKDVGAFAGYTLLYDYTTINYNKGGLQIAADHNDVIPAGVVQSYEGAAATTLSLFTSGIALNNSLGLASLSPESYKEKKILIWGGATSTGFVAIQLAKKIFGLTVITVARSKHHASLKERGADFTYDYKTENVVDIIRKEHSDIIYGLDTVSNKETFQSVYDILANNSHIDNLLFLKADDIKTDANKNVKFGSTSGYDIINEEIDATVQITPRQSAVRRDFEDFVNKKISLQFLQHELYHPELLLIKDSFLNSVEEGLDLLRTNKVSGQKVVIRASDVLEK